ncbi:hypothetical protein BDW59DRAFT_125678 [Aspergillus cavernicola]|uniref:GPI anchored glycoprotein n=1 Tax=Aspergillus cavernicola TaxID=176166 RepID=A0ABR4IY80_9EURO
MRPQIIRSLALLGCSSFAAANDVVSLIFPNVDQQPLVADVIGSDGPMTTYVINCRDGADSDDCGVAVDGMTVTAGPTAFIYEYTFEDYWLRESCKYRSTTWISCAVTNTQSDFSTAMSSAESIDLTYVSFTVTATSTDADADSTAAATTTNTAAQSGSTASDSPSVTSSTQPSETASATTDDDEADAETTSSDNAAIAQATGSTAQWLVSGAGMALALALA